MAEYLIQEETLVGISNAIKTSLRGKHTENTKLTIDPFFLTEKEGWINSELVEEKYIEYVNWEESYDAIEGFKEQDWRFIYYEMGLTPYGERVPILYKTEVSEDSPYKDIPDMAEPHYYVGTKEFEGVVYDRWRKIENSDDATFTWETSWEKYVYTNRIVIKEEVYTPQQMINQITTIVEDVTSSATATPQSILAGDTAWVNGELITGNIPVRDLKELQMNMTWDPIEKAFVTETVVSAGYYPEGVATATDSQWLEIGHGATITPTTKDKLVIEDAYVDGQIIVKGDPNLISKNIAKGVTIFGVPGTYVSGEWYVPVINQTKYTPSLVSQWDRVQIDFSGFSEAGEGFYSYQSLFDNIGDLTSPLAPQDIENSISVVTDLPTDRGLHISVRNYNPNLYLYAYFIVQESADQKWAEEYGQVGFDYSGVIVKVPPLGEATKSVYEFFDIHHASWDWHLEGIRYSLI